MKKHLYFLFMVFIPCHLYAQPVIYNMENNPMGMVAKFVQCSTTGISPGSSGPGVTWNETALTHLGTANDTFYASTIANYGSTAPTATRIDSFTSTSNFGGNFYVNQSSGTTNLLYVVLNTTDYYYYTGPVTGLLTAKQPIHYTDTYTDTFNYTYVSSSPTVTVNGYYTVNADGYGILNLPGSASYNNVLRIHITEIDTSHDGSGAHLSTRNTYTWYDDNHSEPLCKIIYDTFSSGNSISAYFLLSQTPLVSVKNVNNEKTEFSACFASNGLILNSKFEQGDPYSVSVFNMNGQKVYSNSFKPSGNSVSLNIDNWLCPGIYMVALTDNSTHGFSTIKVLKQ